MGLRQAIRLVEAVPAPVNGRPRPILDQQVGPQSPYPTDGSTLSQVVWPDLLDQPDLLPMTRAEAMSVPAIAKGRHVVCPRLAGYPLVALRGDDPIPEQPSWITRTDDPISPWHRMVWTADDLIFTGWSLWFANRGARQELLSASRVGRSRWNFDEKWNIKVDGESVPADQVILIPGPHEGIINYGRVGIRHAKDLMAAVLRAGKIPTPTMELHNEGEDLPPGKLAELLNAWAAARRGENAGVAYTNKWVSTKEHKAIDGALLIEGRNAAAVECARVIGIAAAMIDATVPKASLNYETTEGRGLEHTEYGVEPYAEAIAARLSLDDVVPRGQRVRFDISSDVGPVQPTGPPVGD